MCSGIQVGGCSVPLVSKADLVARWGRLILVFFCWGRILPPRFHFLIARELSVSGSAVLDGVGVVTMSSRLSSGFDILRSVYWNVALDNGSLFCLWVDPRRMRGSKVVELSDAAYTTTVVCGSAGASGIPGGIRLHLERTQGGSKEGSANNH